MQGKRVWGGGGGGEREGEEEGSPKKDSWGY